tara:strand:- start:208 stop:459 length:252 start_codon:yes stop_codon:yes gene_type:complete
MPSKYRELNISGGIKEKRKLVREHSGKNVLIRDSSSGYTFGGKIYFNERNTEHYLLISDKKNKQSLNYNRMLSLEVCVNFSEV